MMAIQRHKAGEYCDRALDQFEQIYANSADSARVMALVAHPYLMGAPHRVKYLRRVFEVIRQKRDVLFWTGAQIVDWYVVPDRRRRDSPRQQRRRVQGGAARRCPSKAASCPPLETARSQIVTTQPGIS